MFFSSQVTVPTSPQFERKAIKNENEPGCRTRKIGQKLSSYALKGKWKKVFGLYRRHPWTHSVKINSYKDTALHVAADLGLEDTVKELLDIILERPNQGGREIGGEEHPNQGGREIEEGEALPNQGGREIKEGEEQVVGLKVLEMRNVNGDTALHLAASRGFANICNWIARANNGLLDIRNNNGETPLFLTALNWHRDAFLLLYFQYFDHCPDSYLHHFRRNNGDSIIHTALDREYFELAILSINLKKDLVGSVNEQGKTCLHVLATKPSAFKSSTSLGWWKAILYYFIHVPTSDDQIERSRKEIDEKYPAADIVLTKERNKKCYTITSIWRKVIALFGFVDDKNAKVDTENPEISEENKYQNANTESSRKNDQHRNFQPNDGTIYDLVKKACESALQPLGREFIRTKKIKEKHVWAAQILEAFPKHFTRRDGKQPFRKDACELSKLIKFLESQNKEIQKECKEVNTAFLEAGRHGIVEIVDMILKSSPVAIHDKTLEGRKNILLLAVENRQPRIVKRLEKENLWNSLILGKDTEDNTILHLAAKASTYKPWRIPGSAMQMLWDIKWYQYVKEQVPSFMPFQINKEGKTPGEVFTEEHSKLVDESSEWLKDTSNSCSVVAALIAGVSFATSSSVPGGINDQGKAPLEGHPAFSLFAVSSMASLCFSITALIMFLSILTSRKQAKDFRRDLPIKLLLGLSSLFLAIASTLVTFCSANFFVIQDKFKKILLPIYAATCLPVSFYAVAQLPLYIDLVVAIFAKTPQRSGWRDDI